MKVEVFIQTPGQAAAFKQFLDAYISDQHARDHAICEVLTARATAGIDLPMPETPKPATKATPPKAAPAEAAVATTQELPPVIEVPTPPAEKSPFDLLTEQSPAETPAAEAPKKRGRPKKEAAIEAAVEKELSIDDVRAAGKIVMENIDIEAIQSTLAKFGAAQMKDLRQQDYALVMQHFRKLMNDAGKVWPQ